MRARPETDFMSTAMDVLRRERMSGVVGGGDGVWAPGVARSRRSTVAP